MQCSEGCNYLLASTLMMITERRKPWLLVFLMCLSFTACIMAAVTPPDGNAMLSCTNHFILHDNFCYRYYGPDVRKAFHHAQKLCSRHQSALVSLHSYQEEEFVISLAVNHSGFWIGLNDEDGPGKAHKEGRFKWSAGEEEFNDPTSYCRWKSGEPANKRHLDCVKVDIQGWAMAPGGCAASKLPFVCKKRACPLEHYWDGTKCIMAPLGEDQPQVTVQVITASGPMIDSTSLHAGLLLMLVMASLGLLCICYTLWVGNQHSRQLRTNRLPEELFPT